MTGENVLDVRKVALEKRHGVIFEEFDKLSSGEILTLINDHNPEPLYYQMAATREDFDAEAYEVEAEGPLKWVAKLKKR